MRRILVGSLCVVLGGLLGLLVVEVLLRVAYPGHFSALMEHPELGQVVRPNHGGWKTYGVHERVVHIQTNSMGLRSAEIPATRVPGVRRVLALGDSFTFGDAVEQEEAWPHELEKRLNEGQSTYRYEVINAGVSGYGTGQQLLLYRRLEGRLYPDLVMVGFSVVNDLLDNLCVDEGSYRPRADAPCFTMENGELTVRRPQLSGDQRDRPPRSWWGHSRAAAFFVGQAKQVMIWNPGVLDLLQHVGALVELPYVPATVVSWYDMQFTEPGWALTRQLLLEFRRTLGNRGVPMVILIIPSSLQVEEGKGEILRLLGQHDKRVQAYLQDPVRPQRLMREFCAEVGLECVDVLPTLLEAQARGERPYYPVDQHWTPIGHRIAALLVAQRLRDLGLVRRTHTAGRAADVSRAQP